MANKKWTHLKLKNGDNVSFIPPAPNGAQLGGITQSQRESISQIQPLKSDVEQVKTDVEQVKQDVTQVKEDYLALERDKISKPETAPVVGKVLKVKSVNADGTFVCEWADSGADLTDYVKRTDYATTSLAGVVKPFPAYGTSIGGGGAILVNQCIESELDARSSAYKPITPAKLNYALTAGLTDSNHIVLTEEQQAVAQEVLGILSVEGVTF